MCIQTGIPSSSRQILTISERNVLTIRGLVALRQSKINNINGTFRRFSGSDQKVVGLYISVDDPFLVYNLYSLNHLHTHMKASFEVEFASALLELVLKTLPQQVHDHYMKHLTVLSLLIAHKM